jgi:hypothetical protein
MRFGGYWILALILLLLIQTASAIPLLPCEISGSVTINGDPAPAGTKVAALIGEVEQDRIIMQSSGVFGGGGPFDRRIVIQGREEMIGSAITFTVNDRPAEITVPFTSGESIRVELAIQYIRGDLNTNGGVDIGDVAKVAYMAAGLVSEDLEADFDGDGHVTGADAAWIAYFYVGKIQAL